MSHRGHFEASGLILLMIAVTAASAQTTPNRRTDPAATTATRLNLTFYFDEQDLTLRYKLRADRMDGANVSVTLQSAETFFHNAGALVNATATNSQLTETAGRDPFGHYAAQRWSVCDSATVPSSCVVFEARYYAAKPDIVTLHQHFPSGIAAAAVPPSEHLNQPVYDTVATSFPSFMLDNARLGYVHFSGYMAGNYPQYGTWSDMGAVSLHGGIQDSGVMCLFGGAPGGAESPGVTLVISPLTEPMASSSSVNPAASMHWGIMGNVTSLPVDFAVSWLIVASPFAGNASRPRDNVTRGSTGVNNAVRQWGLLMQHWHGRQSQGDRHRDPTLRYMGYSTDNGAFYYYYTGPHHANYGQLIPDIRIHAREQNIPYRYVQLDSWWYYQQDGWDKAGVPFSGVTNWTARPDVFPNGGLPGLFNATDGWLVQAHNRFWATNNVYASNPTMPIGPTQYHGKTFEFEWGPTAGLPKTLAFWDYLFGINTDWGLIVYEQDWLSTTTFAVPALTQNATFGGMWLTQMATAAAAHNLTIQLCMSFPRHVLHAVSLPAVTQARASNDYQPQSVLFDYDQWRIGESSLWTSALGIAPSKDSYWSEPISQYDPHYDFIWNTTETRNRLESVVASMSAGPVQISDRIGFTNRSLVMKCCREDGVILHPDVSAAPIDAYFETKAFNNGQRASTGQIHFTYSTAGTQTFFYVLSVNLVDQFSLYLSDLSVTTPSALVGNVFVAYEANTSADRDATRMRLVTNGQPLTFGPCTEVSFEYWTLAPVPDGPVGIRWMLLGEFEKWITSSSERFVSVQSLSDGGVRTRVRGAASESVVLRFLSLPFHPSSSTVVFGACSVSAVTMETSMSVAGDGTVSCS